MERRDPDPPLERLLHHRAWLRALAARLVGATAADDLVQDTWLAALRHPPDPARPPRPWLATVARRLAGRSRRSPSPRPDEIPEGELPSTGELIERIDTEKRLATEVARLDEPFRTTVLLRYYEGLSSAEIARRQGVPDGTVRWRLKRGLELMRERLDGAYGDRQTWGLALGQLLGGTGATAGAAAVTSGGLLMSTWGKLGGVAAAAVVLLAGGVAVRELVLPDTASAPRVDHPSPVAPAALAGGETASADLQPAVSPEGRREAGQAAPVEETTPALRVRVLEWDDRPSAGLLAVLVRPDGELVEETTDAEGRVAFRDVDGRGRVLFDRRGAPPHGVELAAEEGEQVVRLPRGEMLSGRIEVDGGAPERPLELELFRAERISRRTEGGAPRARRILDPDALVHARTAADGSFRFVGLERSWRGNLQLPRGYTEAGLPEEQTSHGRVVLHFSEPREDVVIELASLPRLHGRIVDGDRDPVARPGGVAHLTWSDGTNTDIGLAGDEEGRFELFLEEADYRSVRLEYWGPGESGRDAVELRREDVGIDGDVGVLRLAPSRDVRLLVTDVEGSPVAGAQADHGGAESGAAGEMVLASFPVQAHAVRLRARGFRSREVEVPAALEDALVVVLEPTNELAVTVVDRAGEPLGAVSVELIAEESPLQGRNPRVVAGRWTTTNRGEGEFRAWMTTDGDGLLTLQELRPGAPFGLRVLGDCGAVLHAEEVAPLEDDEARSLVLRLEQDLGSFAVRVVDGGGEPIPGASVGLRWDGDTVSLGEGPRITFSGREADSFGEVAFARLGRTSYRFEVRKDGYLPHVVPGYRPPLGETVEVALVRGVDVEARVVDRDGRPVPGGRLAFEVAGEERSLRETEPGRFALRGLADAPLEVVLTLAGATYRATHDPREPELSFVVPVHGSVEVGWDRGLEPAWEGWVRIVLDPRDPEPSPLVKSIHDLPATGSRTFAPVLPGKYELVVLRGYADSETEEELTERVPVTVVADRTAIVTLPR